MRKLALATIIITSSLLPELFAQDQKEIGLFLTGQLSDAQSQHSDEYVVWKARLDLELKNMGDKPIILINPTLPIGTGQKELTFYFKSPVLANDGKETAGFSHKITKTDDQLFLLRQLANDLDADSPPENLTIVLRPGETFPFSDFISVRQRFLDEKPSPKYILGTKRWEGTMDSTACYSEWFKSSRVIGCRLSYASSLVITYEFDLTSLHKSPNLLGTLSMKWRRIGVLPLDKTGSISFVSKPIVVYPIVWQSQ